MGQRAFDEKFGSALVGSLPQGPGIYLFRDAEQGVLYVGKAKNIRRRLQSYRNASRRKVHRKMRTLVREASSLEVRVQESESDALLEENALIRKLRPPYNVDGAFAFLYPALGIGQRDGHMLLCFSTTPEAYAELDLRWFGTFRSRPRAKESFDALVELLALIGHLIKRTQLPAHRSVRGSRLVGLRQLPREVSETLAHFLGGEDRALLPTLSSARWPSRAPSTRGGVSRCWAYEADTRKLRLAMERLGRTESYVTRLAAATNQTSSTRRANRRAACERVAALRWGQGWRGGPQPGAKSELGDPISWTYEADTSTMVQPTKNRRSADEFKAHGATGSAPVGLRQLPREVSETLAHFLGGEDRALLPTLSTALLAKPRARHDAARVEECLRVLDRFYEADTRKLRLAMERLGRTESYVPQDERDSLFISASFEPNQ